MILGLQAPSHRFTKKLFWLCDGCRCWRERSPGKLFSTGCRYCFTRVHPLNEQEHESEILKALHRKHSISFSDHVSLFRLRPHVVKSLILLNNSKDVIQASEGCQTNHSRQTSQSCLNFLHCHLKRLCVSVHVCVCVHECVCVTVLFCF